MEASTLFISTEVFVAHGAAWSGRIGCETRFKAICESYDLSFVTAKEPGGGTRINARHVKGEFSLQLELQYAHEWHLWLSCISSWGRFTAAPLG